MQEGPSSGTVQQIMLSCKARYKLAIMNAYTKFKDKMNDELYSHFINKKSLISGKVGMQNLGTIPMHMSLSVNIQNDVFACHFRKVHYHSVGR